MKRLVRAIARKCSQSTRNERLTYRELKWAIKSYSKLYIINK